MIECGVIGRRRCGLRYAHLAHVDAGGSTGSHDHFAVVVTTDSADETHVVAEPAQSTRHVQPDTAGIGPRRARIGGAKHGRTDCGGDPVDGRAAEHRDRIERADHGDVGGWMQR